MTTDAPAYSPVRRAGDLLFVSGQLGLSTTGPHEGVAGQTKLALERLAALLEEQGASAADVVKCTVFLSDIAAWAEMNEAYGSFFESPYPSRSAVGAVLAPGALVEIEAVAYFPAERA